AVEEVIGLWEGAFKAEPGNAEQRIELLEFHWSLADLRALGRHRRGSYSNLPCQFAFRTEPKNADRPARSGHYYSNDGSGGLASWLLPIRAYASPFCQNSVAVQDFVEKSRVQGSGEALAGDAERGRVRLK